MDSSECTLLRLRICGNSQPGGFLIPALLFQCSFTMLSHRKQLTGCGVSDQTLCRGYTQSTLGWQSTLGKFACSWYSHNRLPIARRQLSTRTIVPFTTGFR